jgi:hypothetical protein
MSKKNREKKPLGPLRECPFCEWKWHSRVEEPKECPRCKRYLRVLPGTIELPKSAEVYLQALAPIPANRE